MHIGTIVWWDDNLGYGFLRADAWDDHVFIHYSKIVSDEKYKSLNKGDVVKFVGTTGERGAFAIEVIPTGKSIAEEIPENVATEQ